MKYRVEFPIKFDCNLQCYYCFHANYHNNHHPYTNGKRFERAFSLEQWEQWRDKFLVDADEVLIMFAGGEPFIPVNSALCRELMEHCADSIQSYEFLTNGLFNKEDVEFLKGLKGHEGLKNKIHRIGFTYHRRMIHDKPELVKKFYDNLLYLKNMGIPVYVKELLRIEDKTDIINHRVFLRKHGIELKIQDYKGDDRGLDCTEIQQYTQADCALVDMEYKHAVNKPCSCLRGYKGIAIRGYDEYSGNVIACWHDPVVVGNIQEMRFNPNFTVNILPDGTKDVTGVSKKYAGKNYRDLPIIINERSCVMSKWSENRMNELRGELGAADEQIDKRRGEIVRVKIEADERTGEIQKEVNRLQDIRKNIVIAITLISEQIRAESLEAKPESVPEVPAPVEAETAHNYVP